MNGLRLTARQELALIVLHLRTAARPLDMGWQSREALAYDPRHPGRWTPPPETRVLRALVARGLVEIHDDGHWPSWRMTEAGRESASALLVEECLVSVTESDDAAPPDSPVIIAHVNRSAPARDHSPDVGNMVPEAAPRSRRRALAERAFARAVRLAGLIWTGVGKADPTTEAIARHILGGRPAYRDDAFRPKREDGGPTLAERRAEMDARDSMDLAR